MSSPPKSKVAPIFDSTSAFKDDIFKGKVLFCTGGGSGICRSMTEAMLRHGASACIIGRNAEKLVLASRELSETTGGKCIYAQADVRQPKALQDAVTKTIKEFGRIDFVICGAAGNFLAPISELSENAFRTVVEIDTIGTYNTVKATLPYVRESSGSYVHCSATLHYRGTPYQAHVSAAKAGVDALSAVIAVEEGPRGVRSNVIAPGPVAGTEGADRLTNKADVGHTQLMATLPLGRPGDVKDCANAAVFLFSPAAAFITGHVMVVDGGNEQLRTPYIPYPKGVLDFAGVKHMIKPRL